MNKKWIINSTTDELRYVTSNQQVAEEIMNRLEANKDNSETEYFLTNAIPIESVDELSKFDYLDAEKDEGDVLIYFYKEDGEWFRTYTKPEHADNVLKSLPHFTRWEIK